MDFFGPIDWHGVFVPDNPLLGTVLRGSLVYLAFFALPRVVLKRQSGSMAITDLIVVVLIADAAQNAMTSGYHSVPDGIILVATIIGWNYFLDWLAFRHAWFGHLIYTSPLALVENGKILRKHLREVLISIDELMSQLREPGVDEVKDVKRAYMEGDGRVSVILYRDDKDKPVGGRRDVPHPGADDAVAKPAGGVRDQLAGQAALVSRRLARAFGHLRLRQLRHPVEQPLHATIGDALANTADDDFALRVRQFPIDAALARNLVEDF